jgi:hypothetical protein
MSSAEDEYKREGRLMQLSPQEQMKYVDATINNMKYVGDLSRIDILNLLREALKGKDLNEYTADSDQTYQAFLKVYHNRKQGQGGRRKSKSRSKKSRSKSRSKKSRSKKSRSKKSRSKSRK